MNIKNIQIPRYLRDSDSPNYNFTNCLTLHLTPISIYWQHVLLGPINSLNSLINYGLPVNIPAPQNTSLVFKVKDCVKD